MNVIHPEPQWEGLTIGPDGTLIGRPVGETADVVQSLDLYWIHILWDCTKIAGGVAEIAGLADGLGPPGTVPPRLDYRPTVRASSRPTRIAMLAIARCCLNDATMAQHLKIPIGVLGEVLHDAYGLPRRLRKARSQA